MLKVKLRDLKTLNKDQVYHWNKKKSLISDVYDNGYDINKGFIRITSDFYIIDGHHRCKILTTIFGDDYDVQVKQYKIKKQNYLIILSSILIILSPLIIIYLLFKNGFNKNIKRDKGYLR